MFLNLYSVIRGDSGWYSRAKLGAVVKARSIAVQSPGLISAMRLRVTIGNEA